LVRNLPSNKFMERPFLTSLQIEMALSSTFKTLSSPLLISNLMRP
jgi:hypothetical protein